MQLRPYQQDSFDQVHAAWNRGVPNVLAVLPTGGGKTVVFSEIIKSHGGPTCAIAHRKELVTQMSLTLARDGVRHRIVGPLSVSKLAMRQHHEELGQSWIDPGAQVAVAGVDTLIRRHDALADWCESVTLWVTDECHHISRPNKWYQGVNMFPNAKGLGVTATPCRADGRGLGRHADGVFDEMIVGPGMRDLIDQRYLTDYRIFAPPSDLDLSEVKTGASGEFSPRGASKAVMKSSVVGDVVKHYLRIAPNKLGITFATDVAAATEIANKFNVNNVPAEVVSAKTPDAERSAILRRFKRRELLQLVNVDLFGEGFDLPSLEVVSMARPTQSFSLFAQQFGRALRIMPGKTEAIIIDHVGNIVDSTGKVRHGLPDARREWTLDRREKASRSAPSDAIPVKACPSCAAVYERTFKDCPFCGHYAEPAIRSGPEHVDGDLLELDAAALAALRGNIEAVDMSAEQYRERLAAKHAPLIGQKRNVKLHVERQEAQEALRAAIAWWGGMQRHLGRPDSESYRLFYHKFGTDVLTAQTYRPTKAFKLANKINKELVSI